MRKTAPHPFFLLLLCATAAGRPLRVALHAQSRYEVHGWVAGSEVTTAGLQRAMLAGGSASSSGSSGSPGTSGSSGSSGSPSASSSALHQAGSVAVGRVQVFAPFSYGGLAEGCPWDVVVSEGWSHTLPEFYHRVRLCSPDVVVAHWCLDTYPKLERVEALEVDAFFTNSWAMLPRLASLVPAVHFLELAADPEVMRPSVLAGSPFSPQLASHSSQPPPSNATSNNEYNHPVVYLGAYTPNNEKRFLDEILREALP